MKILIADEFEKFGLEQLRGMGCELLHQPGLKGPALVDAVRTFGPQVLIVRSTKVTDDALKASPTLELVVRAGSGFDTIDVPAATRYGVRICNCPGMNSVAVAELTFGFMIALDRRIVDETTDLRRRVWNKKEYSKARGLKGRTIGIVGMGRIGREVARRAWAFDMDVMYSDVTPRPDVEEQFNARRVSLPVLLREADFVTLHVPGGEETTHMIGPAELGLMKPTAFIINCSRGGVIDETALAQAIQAGTVAGAALDVWEVEPAATEKEFKDPIAGVPRVYGTHHVGASTEQAQQAVAEETVRIIREFKEHYRFLNCVNPETLVPVG